MQSRGDEPFQVLEKVTDNSYKLDLLGECNIFATFNVFEQEQGLVDQGGMNND